LAEHLHQHIEPELSGFNRMGHPLSETARSAAYETCKQMGLNSARAWECVQAVATALERDQPYQAQAAGMRFLDLTGTYRLFAVLLMS
jgi:hypothetical protein